jgi:RimJ/RimL family protein N-acetyltransferase
MRFPFQQGLVLEGRNIVLRSLSRQHAEALYRLVDRNRSDLQLSFPILSNEVISTARARNWIAERQRLQKQGQQLVFSLISRNDGGMLGYLAAVHIEHRVPKCELAYFMDAAFRGRGYMKEGLELLLDVLFYSLKFNKVLCRVAPENEPSLRLLEGLGFEREGLIRNDFRSGQGQLGDCIYLGKMPKKAFSTEIA